MTIGTKDMQNIIADAKIVVSEMEWPVAVLEFRQRLNGIFNLRDCNRNLKEPEYRVALSWLLEGGFLGFTKDRKLTNEVEA